MSNKDKLTFSQGTGDVLVASDKPHLRRLDHQCWSLGQLSALGEEGETLIKHARYFGCCWRRTSNEVAVCQDML
jgi:hypothetical protein